MGSANITLEEILRRRIEFLTEDFGMIDREDCDDSDPYSLSYDEIKTQYDGEIRAYKEMYDAVCSGMNEYEFVEKFLGIMNEYEDISRSSDANDKIIDINTGRMRSELEKMELGAYFSAAKEILGLFFPITTAEDFE